MNFRPVSQILLLIVLGVFGFVVLAVPLTLITIPPQSLVYIDDVLVGQTNPNGVLKLNVDLGAKIRIENIGYFPNTFLYSPSSKEATVVVNLKPISYLSLKSNPQGARVTIDGGEEIITPATIEIASGKHSLKIFKSGYVPQHFVINVKPFSAVVKDFLLRRSGKVTIRSLPNHANLDVDGEFVGLTPISTILSVGIHTLTLSATGYSKVSTSLTILKDSTSVSVWVKLRKLATISVYSSPSGAVISMAGTTFTTPATLTLELGKYTYTASQTFSYFTKGEIEVNGSGRYTVKLKRIMGLVVFTSNPMGAAVKLDGKLKGQTQLSLSIPYGNYSVKMIGPGDKVWFNRVTIDRKITTIYGDMVNTGMVLVNSNPSTHTIVHIGQIWTTVPATLNAGVGVYKVEVFNPAYPTVVRYIRVKGGKVSRLSVSLESKAKLFMLSEPLSATVFLDGKKIGCTPLFNINVPVGDHLITVQWKDGEVQRHFLFEKNKVYNLTFSDPRTVKVTFISFPDPVRLFIDGKDEGYTPCSLTLSRQKHSYEVYDVTGAKVSEGEFYATAFSSKTYFFLDTVNHE